MAKSGPFHRTSGDDSLRFIHERSWLTVARVGDDEGAEKLRDILDAGQLPDGRWIDRWAQTDPTSDVVEVQIYIREELT